MVEGGVQNLIGKETAINLGIFKIGLNTNSVAEDTIKKPFPKI